MGAPEFLHEAASTARQGAPSRGQACYVAASSSGPLLLELAAPAGHAAEAAIALMRCDELLGALEAWTGLALDWRWIPAPSWRLSAGSHARVQWQLGDALRGTVELPWALLRGLDVPPAALAECLAWPTLPAVLAVSSVRLAMAELRLLEPGGALVLPESLCAPWRGRLRGADEPAHPDTGVPVDLSCPAAPRLVASAGRCTAERADEVVGDDRIACEVRLDVVRALPADRLAGWCEGESPDGVGAHATLWRCAGACGPAQRLASGRLMPWGDGWALAIESLDDAEPTLIFTR